MALFDQQTQYAGGGYYAQHPDLQFYSGSPGVDPSAAFYPGARPSLEGNVVAGAGSGSGAPNFGGSIQPAGGWLSAFGTGGFEGEPPLLEELGVNLSHIRAKSLAVLNPLGRVDEHIMDDADLAGPLIILLCLATCLLMSGRPQFGYIYGVAVFGSGSLYTLLNLMSESGIDAYRVASVLGYCLLPMVGVGALSVCMVLDGAIGYILSILSVIWCTYAASGIFVAVLRLSDQRVLVAYPIGLLYGCFALFSVFGVTGGAQK
ncbi:unnamed protein product [Rhizoctonia solani]|uniref:Protein YIP n=1 Tax=Rhizoctonia solani TaxID=456999 RepID=A0A8H2XR64_9AGAM|nr:unnamed protein product [Rhizoctonia solani]